MQAQFCVSNSQPVQGNEFVCVGRPVQWYCQYRLRIGLFVSLFVSIERAFVFVNGFSNLCSFSFKLKATNIYQCQQLLFKNHLSSCETNGINSSGKIVETQHRNNQIYIPVPLTLSIIFLTYQDQHLQGECRIRYCYIIYYLFDFIVLNIFI